MFNLENKKILAPSTKLLKTSINNFLTSSTTFSKTPITSHSSQMDPAATITIKLVSSYEYHLPGFQATDKVICFNEDELSHAILSSPLPQLVLWTRNHPMSWACPTYFHELWILLVATLARNRWSCTSCLMNYTSVDQEKDRSKLIPSKLPP